MNFDDQKIKDFLVINGGKYIINTFEDGGNEIEYLLPDGNWQPTTSHAPFNPSAEVDANGILAAKIFDSINAAKAEISSLTFPIYNNISGKRELLSYKQLTDLINQVRASEDADYEYDIFINRIPTLEEVMEDSKISGSLEDSLLSLVYNDNEESVISL